MTRKNLADVLLKVLGLYFCLHTIPSLIIGTAVGLTTGIFSELVKALTIGKVIEIATTGGVQAIVGIYLIFRSRKIAERWFKNEDE